MYTGDPMTAAELRDRAVRRLTSTPRPTPEDVAEADAWARIAISAASSLLSLIFCSCPSTRMMSDAFGFFSSTINVVPGTSPIP